MFIINTKKKNNKKNKQTKT